MLLLHVEEVPPHLGCVPVGSEVQCAVPHRGRVRERFVPRLCEGGHIVGAHRRAIDLVAGVTL